MSFFASTNSKKTLVPTWNNLSNAEFKGERFKTIEARVELGAVHQEAAIVNSHLRKSKQKCFNCTSLIKNDLR